MFIYFVYVKKSSAKKGDWLAKPLDIEAAVELFIKRNNIYCLILSIWSLGIQSISTPEFERVPTSHPASQLRSLMKLLVMLQKKKKTFCSTSRGVFHLRRS